MNEIGQVTGGQSAVHACHHWCKSVQKTGPEYQLECESGQCNGVVSVPTWTCSVPTNSKAAPSCRAAATAVARHLLEPLQSCHSCSAAHLLLSALACHVRPRQPPAKRRTQMRQANTRHCFELYAGKNAIKDVAIIHMALGYCNSRGLYQHCEWTHGRSGFSGVASSRHHHLQPACAVLPCHYRQ